MVLDVTLAWSRDSAVTTLIDSDVHDDRAGLHRLDHLLGDNYGSDLAWYECATEDDVHILDMLRQHLTLML